ncbi:MAG: FtsX-like permease family protein [Ruminococcus sp.]|nr:FtsX-like permease family protein [Ruminococcus sp.]
MNVFHKVTLETLKKNRVRTIVTIIGIILSTALICAVTTSVASFLEFGKKIVIQQEGDWHGCTSVESYDEFKKIEDASEVSKAFCYSNIGNAKMNYEREAYSQYDPILAANEEFFNSMPVNIVKGRLPESSDEIIFTPFVLEYMYKSKYKVGDKITFDIGDLEILDDDEAESKYDFKYKTSRTYTIVGEYDSMLLDGDLMTLDDGGEALCDNADEYAVYFKMKKPNKVYSFMSNNDLIGSTNDELLAFSGVAKNGSSMLILCGFATFLIALIVFGSIALIYNAFAISINERTKQLGLLSSVGATRKQIKKMIGYESFIVSVIGIPLGIILGIAGIETTFALLGDKLASISEMSADNIKLKLVISPIAIIASILIAQFTVRMSSWIPTVRAQRVTAVEAIRQNNDIKSGKKVRTPKLVYKVFGFPGMLAHKYFKRNKKKYRATIVSLFMSIVLFISAASFTTYLVESAETSFDSLSYDIEVVINDNEDISKDSEQVEELFNKMKAIDDVTDSAYTLTSDATGFFSADDMSDYVKDTHSANDENKYELTMNISFISDEAYKKFLKKEGLSESDYMDPDHPLAIVVDGFNMYDTFTQKYEKRYMFKHDDVTFDSSVYVGDKELCENYEFAGWEKGKMKYSKIDRKEGEEPEYKYIDESELYTTKELKIGHITENEPIFTDDSFTKDTTLYYPLSFRDSMFTFYDTRDSGGYRFVFTSDDHKNTTKKIREILDDENILLDSVYDYAEEVEMVRNLITIIKVFAYGFIIIISLIAAANVFNTISTNISLRRKEFAMLRSVGMSSKGLNKMMNFECLLYGFKALILGLPVSALINYALFMLVSEGFETKMHMPWNAVALAVFSVFAVVFSTMLYSMSKIKKDNTIDALKNENA